MRGVLFFVFLLTACHKESDYSRCARVVNAPLSHQSDLEVVVACAPLFRPECRTALGTARKSRTVPEALAIVDRCARAYCPLADQELCKPQRDTSPAATRDQLRPFVAAALAGTPGATARDLDTIGFAMASELIPQQTLRLRVSAGQGQLVLSLSLSPPGASWHTADPPAPADLDRLKATLRERLPDRTNSALTIEGLHALSKEARRAIDSAVRDAGYEFVACRADMRNCVD